MHTINGDKTKCKFCEKEVSTIIDHICAVHKKEKYICATCHKQFTRANLHLKMHIDSIHSKIKYPCPLYEKIYT